jgi:hypothetical protein
VKLSLFKIDISDYSFAIKHHSIAKEVISLDELALSIVITQTGGQRMLGAFDGLGLDLLGRCGHGRQSDGALLE